MVFFYAHCMVRSSGESVGVVMGPWFIYKFHVVVGPFCVPAMDPGWEFLRVSIILQVSMVCVYQDRGFLWGVFEQIAPVAQSSHDSEVLPVVYQVVSFGRAEGL